MYDEVFPVEAAGSAAPDQDSSDDKRIASVLQVLQAWKPPPFGRDRPFNINERIGASEWRPTGRGNFACPAPFRSELIIYDRVLPYRCWRASLHKTLGLKWMLPGVDWRVCRHSPKLYGFPRDAALRAWKDILAGLGRSPKGFDPDDWEVSP